MIQDDFLLRQIRSLATLVARIFGKRRDESDEEAEATCAALVGLDLSVAANLPARTLVGLLTTADGLDADRCLALGLGLALRSRRARARGDSTLARRIGDTARTLLATAVLRKPALDGPELHAVLEALAPIAEA
jgi:hypothetical protein